MKKPLLMVSESTHNADMFYASHFLAADPFIYLRFPSASTPSSTLPSASTPSSASHEEKDILVVSQMEYERARKETTAKEVRSTLDYGYNPNLKTEELLLRILQQEGLNAVEVPRYFPLYTAEELRKRGVEVEVVAGETAAGGETEITKERETKNEYEINCIRKAQRACEHAMQTAVALIKSVSKLTSEKLTSERVKACIEHDLIDSGCNCDGGEPIVACGKRAADPHFTGSGPILANEPVVIDIFPRLKSERYFADMTRTVVKGEPAKEVQEMYEAVKHAQDAALGLVKEGVTCREVHNRVCEVFEERGYGTVRKGSKTGFIHSTGHGVGLDLHETPSVGENDYLLRSGNVVTIEPGLYDPEVGGVRLEDLVLVLKGGCENLTRFEKRLSL